MSSPPARRRRRRRPLPLPPLIRVIFGALPPLLLWCVKSGVCFVMEDGHYHDDYDDEPSALEGAPPSRAIDLTASFSSSSPTSYLRGTAAVASVGEQKWRGGSEDAAVVVDFSAPRSVRAPPEPHRRTISAAIAASASARQLSQSIIAAATTEHVPTVAAYVDESNPTSNSRLSSYIKVDDKPHTTISYLRFNDLPSSSTTSTTDAGTAAAVVERVELILKCTDSSPSGGIVYKSTQPITSYVTYNTRPQNERYQIFNRLADIGNVVKGRTYSADISRVILRGGRLREELNLVILPRDSEGNGAEYSKGDVKLVVTYRGSNGGGGGGGGGGKRGFQEGNKVKEVGAPSLGPTGRRIGPFQIMMYHDPPLYMWQSNPARRSWCVDCSLSTWKRDSKSNCKRGATLLIDECDDDNERQHWIYDNGKFRSFTDEGLCWDYGYTYYQLEGCGASDTQTFLSGGPDDPGKYGIHAESFNTNGNFASQRFELYPEHKISKRKKRRKDRRKCVTQEHHPKRGEQLKSQDCKRARRHDTNYWVASDPPRWSGHSLD